MAEQDDIKPLDIAEAELGPPAAGLGVPVVGIAAGAANLQSLERLFAHLPRDPRAAFVVVLRQSDGLDPGRVVEALGRQSGLPADVVSDGLRPQAGHAYVAAGDRLMTIRDGVLQLAPIHNPPGERGSIDSFLISLAEDGGAAAVGLLLASLGAEGTAGFTALKEHGGLTICELDPARTAIDMHPLIDPAGLADFVLPVERMPDRLQHYLAHLEVAGSAPAGDDEAEQIVRIAAVLRNRTGHDFHGYKRNTFMRRVHRRMQVNQIDEIDRYVDFLRTDSGEIGHLFQDLLIGVTQFFRDRPEFDLLASKVLPSLFEAKGAGDQLRIWVLGCATGEEAYSIGILLREHMAGLDGAPNVQIFATDIDGRALTMARSGRYPESIAKDVSPERLARWFRKEGATYCVVKELREMCIFSQHSVIKDAPFSRIDMISCRNLLIYLTAELQERVIPIFHFALKPEGYLFLGPSENVTRHAKLFSPVDRKHRIFRRLETTARVFPEFPLSTGDRKRVDEPRPSFGRSRAGSNLGRQAERVAERYAPAYVIVDETFEVLHFSGRTGRFLEPTAGVATLNLLNLIHRDLRLDLRSALHSASLAKATTKVARAQMDVDGELHFVDVVIEPVVTPDAPLNLVVVFTDVGAVGDARIQQEVSPSVLRDEHVQRLDGELRLVRERLQATIEELESTNEELKSSNEEYQSINEELQSANEELETSKEELQSVNEELQTVNGELAHRVNDLARANSDLKNLLESTQIATVFLDNDLRVKSFTPAMSDVFHLIDSDVGRPITHITARVAYPELRDDVRKVLRTLSTIEHQIGADGERRFLVRVLPYRSIDNFIAGVVLTFLDVSEVTQAQANLEAAEERSRRANAAARIVTWELDTVTDKLNASDYFEEVMGFAPPGDLASLLASFDPIHRDRVADAFEAAKGADAHLDVEGRVNPRLGQTWVRLQGRRIGDRVFGVTQDIADRRSAEEVQKLLVAELQHRVKNILAVIRSISSATAASSETIEEFAAHFSGRLNAMGRTQSVLARRTSEGVELEELVRDELATTTAHEGEQFKISGPPILLLDKAAEAFALALHELATNALKYGALGRSSGRLSIEWRVVNTSSGPKLSLQWQESGVPAVETRPARRGFGRDLIERGLPYDLGAVTALEFAPGGIRCLVELPLGPRVIALNREARAAGSGRPELKTVEEQGATS